MDMDWLKKAKRTPTLLTTYRIGLVQAKAFRILNVRTAELLAPHGIRPLDWALLGLLYDHQEGMSPSALAKELGVKASHVSAQMTRLKKRQLAYDCADPDDKRSKCVGLTEEGLLFVTKTEKELRAGMRGLIGTATVKDVLAYAHVLSEIAENED